MTTNNNTYKLSNLFPAYTVAQWSDTYDGFVRTFYSTPKEDRKGQMWEDFISLSNEVKLFLKNNGVKFI